MRTFERFLLPKSLSNSVAFTVIGTVHQGFSRSNLPTNRDVLLPPGMRWNRGNRISRPVPSTTRPPLHGRPKGSRNRISETALKALADDFDAHGVAVIEKVRTERPHDYLKIIVAVLPKRMEIEDAFANKPPHKMTDDELEAIIWKAQRQLEAMGVEQPLTQDAPIKPRWLQPQGGDGRKNCELDDVEEIEQDDDRNWDADQPQENTAHGPFAPFQTVFRSQNVWTP